MNPFVRLGVCITLVILVSAPASDARIPQLKLEPAGVRRWGETNEANLREYMEDPETIAKAARDYKPH